MRVRASDASASRTSATSSSVAPGARRLPQAATRAGERQPLAKDEPLDLLDLFDVGWAVEPRTFGRLLNPDARKLLFPRTQHIRLELGHFTDVRGPEQFRGHFATQYNNMFKGFNGFWLGEGASNLANRRAPSSSPGPHVDTNRRPLESELVAKRFSRYR